MAADLRPDVLATGRHRHRRRVLSGVLAPGIIAQSVLFISIFYGIQIAGTRDAGILQVSAVAGIAVAWVLLRRLVR